jgi:hypothetical protein
MQGGDLQNKHKKKRSEPLSRKSKVKIPPESKTRSKERISYLKQIKMFWEESVDNKTDFCFFCGEHMGKRDNVHHMKGRIGDYYLDKNWWVNCHNECHLSYHHLSVDILEKQSWYGDFLTRLKLKDENLWAKQVEKKLKTINPQLFDLDEENND